MFEKHSSEFFGFEGEQVLSIRNHRVDGDQRHQPILHPCQLPSAQCNLESQKDAFRPWDAGAARTVRDDLWRKTSRLWASACLVLWLGSYLTAADQLNDLETVPWLHDGGQPLGPGKNFKIALNGHAVHRQAEMGEQAGHTKTRWHLVRFSINYNVDS